MKTAFSPLSIVCIFSLIFTANANSPLIINTSNRDATSLNGQWNYIVDQYENGYYNYRYKPMDQDRGYEHNHGAYFNDYEQQDKTELIEYNFSKSPTLRVPGSWNAQEEELFWYEGTIWYRKHFDYTKKNENNRVFLYFGAINYEAHIYLNGKKVGMHIGGFTPFNFEITGLLKEKENRLVVKADNKRKKEAVPTLNTDWFNYGGITRDVKLIETSPTFIQDYHIQLKKGSMDEISGFIQLNGNDLQQEITIELPELNFKTKVKTGETGKALLSFKLKNLEHWSPENPKLYDVLLTSGDNTLIDQIGFRSLETSGSNILLNGKKVFLRGISIHEENGSRGDRAYSKEDAQMILGRASELNCNFVRLAHYPHNEHMIKTAEKMGIMVWSEIPVYWTIDWENQATYENASQQLEDIINRDKNRANVIIWSVANETPVSEARTKFLTNLIDKARSMDNVRFISAALEKHTLSRDPYIVSIEDPFAQYVDVLSFNQYIGWYDGLPDKCNHTTWTIKFNKPVIISEFGGGALYGFHADKETRWSEEFQEDLYVQNLKMLEQIPQLSGMTPWILSDFRSPRRMLPYIQNGWNRKGVFSENGEKKKAFFILQNYYLNKKKEF
ncbi:MAG: beta-glucuronidase [Prolixibacteraceae bacterium]|nr:beta-glucuronidase [Prolixibacteraceae bacterium]